MAGKKGQVVQLQTEVNNEEDWEKLLTKEGLVVVDIFSEWCGPCVGMVGNLKKVKLEIGGDTLHLAVAKADEIETLKRFRNKSEPTWMFIGGGQLVNVMFGANAPKLMRLIESELKQEQRVMRNETWRQAIPFDELCEEERERFEAAEKIRIEAEQAAAEKSAAELDKKRTKMYTGMARELLYETVVICFPHTLDPEGCVLLPLLEPIWQGLGMFVMQSQKMNITKAHCEEIFYRNSLPITEHLLENLALGPAFVMWLKCQTVPAQPGGDGEKFLNDVEKIVSQALNQAHVAPNQEYVIPHPESVPAQFRWQKGGGEDSEGEDEPIVDTDVPGCWTPASYFTKCAACKELFPLRAEKVIIPEEPPPPPRVVMVFETTKAQECFDLIEQYENEILNIGFFSTGNPNDTRHIAATLDQYKRLPQWDCNRVVVVVSKKRSDPMLTYCSLGPLYVSPDEKVGEVEASKFFPHGVEPTFFFPDEASGEEEAAPEEENAEEETEEPVVEVEQNDDELMAALGI